MHIRSLYDPVALKAITPPFSHTISISVIHREGLWVSASCGDNVWAVLWQQPVCKKRKWYCTPWRSPREECLSCPPPSSFTVNHFLHTVNEASSCALQCPAQWWHWERKRRDSRFGFSKQSWKGLQRRKVFLSEIIINTQKEVLTTVNK